MRFLLDSHIWLWAAIAPERLGHDLRSSLERPENEVFLSLATIWELAIKYSRGRLELPLSFTDYVLERLRSEPAMLLAPSIEHALRVATLPHIHGDPFDRMLVAQALVEGCTLVTSDRRLAEYNVPTVLV